MEDEGCRAAHLSAAGVVAQDEFVGGLGGERRHLGADDAGATEQLLRGAGLGTLPVVHGRADGGRTGVLAEAPERGG